MSNRIYNQKLAIEKQVVSTFGKLVIGAAGAVTSYAGMGIASIAKLAGAGAYRITMEDSFDKFLSFQAAMNSNAVGGSGIDRIEVANDPATLQASFKAKTFDIQLSAFGAGTSAVSEKAASLVSAGVTLYAKLPATAGNGITYAKTVGATAGAEVVSVVGTAISVQVEDGVSTAAQVVAALIASPAAMNLVSAVASTPATAQGALIATALAGGQAAVAAVAPSIAAANAVSGSVMFFEVQARRSSVGPA